MTMGDDLFTKRMSNWMSKGSLPAFNLACVAEALDTVKHLSSQNIGWEEVEQRVGEYKSWDPDIFRVDKDAENGYFRRLEGLGTPFTFLSEEAGHVEINTGKPGERRYVVCDPFDGSYLFKHGIPDFWYSSLAFYDTSLDPLCCAVGDCVTGKIAYCNEEGAFLADLEGENLDRGRKLDGEYRKAMGRPDLARMEGASVESYALKPKKFLLPLVDEYREFLLPFKFFHPNGGPYGFVDVHAYENGDTDPHTDLDANTYHHTNTDDHLDTDGDADLRSHCGHRAAAIQLPLRSRRRLPL